MNKPSNKTIVEHLHNAVSQITPDEADQLWEKPVALAKGDEWFLDGTGTKRHKVSPVVKTVSALAACFLLCFISLALLSIRANATIYLDVNPSVELDINCFDRVVSAQANNADGEAILRDMNLKNTRLNVALNAILGSMVRCGYLSENSSTILISVECPDQERADQLRQDVSSRVKQDMGSLIHSGTVLSQEVQSDDALEDLAQQYSITQGKAALIQALVAEHPELKYEDLAKLSMTELVKALEEKDIDISNHLEDVVDDILDSETDKAPVAASENNDPDDEQDDEPDDDPKDDDAGDKDDLPDEGDDVDDEDDRPDEDDEDNADDDE